MSKVMSINAGSSSLKFQLFEMPEEKVLVSGLIERIGFEDAYLTIKINGKKDKKVLPIKDHKAGVDILLNSLIENNVINALGYKYDSELNSFAEGNGTTASGLHSHAEGYATVAIGNASHAEGGASYFYTCTQNEEINKYKWNTNDDTIKWLDQNSWDYSLMDINSCVHIKYYNAEGEYQT